ncbi:methyl-accepting chemotaxis protein [Rhodovulum sp. ES.010]|uniref:methyl-accepting chemotaxis protein n=1 Tax=Rhodovulum sp. ES.010 TaxID=1882821 RepID=UPI00092ABA59|nr:HAMP domain-containing methyl-accepting chemotaxis protein [Rhodovulum sp. ES.010]SIO43687.1 methyl-accepting chemotaxis protein [Rhodovulum sp. ES.010]
MQPTTDTATAAGVRSSVFLRIAGLIAGTTLIVATLLTVTSVRTGTSLVDDSVVKLLEQVSHASAKELGGHIVFENEVAIQAALDEHVANAGEEFVQLMVWDGAGNLVDEQGDAEAETRGALTTLARTALSTGEIAELEDRFMIAIPIHYGKSGRVVGAFGAVWTDSKMMGHVVSDTAPMMAVIVTLFVALVAGATFLLKRMVGQPLAHVSGAMTRVADGALDNEVPEVHRADEIGVIARSLDALRSKLQQARDAEAAQERDQEDQAAAIELLGRGLTALASGDLTYTIDKEFSGGRDRLRRDFNAAVDTLSELLGSVVENASEINARSNDISVASDDLSRRTENQAATLEETAAALDEMTSSVRAASESAAEVETAVRETRGNAEESGRVVKDAMGAMAEIKNSSDGISQIIGVIDDIAFQTNLLALNAGVEAARAGEAGRGFAVVASEVRALAQRSSEAAKEIKDLISTSTRHVESGVSLVNRTGDALIEIVDRVGNIADLISGIATGAREQSVGLGEINVGMTELDKVTQQNAAMVEETNAAAATLKQESSTMETLVSRFRLKGHAGGAARAPAFRAAADTRDEAVAPMAGRAMAANAGAWHEF